MAREKVIGIKIQTKQRNRSLRNSDRDWRKEKELKIKTQDRETMWERDGKRETKTVRERWRKWLGWGENTEGKVKLKI